MEITLTREEIIKEVENEFGSGADGFYELIYSATFSYDPILELFLRLATMLKDAEKLDKAVMDAIKDVY